MVAKKIIERIMKTSSSSHYIPFKQKIRELLGVDSNDEYIMYEVIDGKLIIEKFDPTKV